MATAVNDKGCVSISPENSSTSSTFPYVSFTRGLTSYYFLFQFMGMMLSRCATSVLANITDIFNTDPQHLWM